MTELWTERLHLRRWRPGDADAVHAACSDPEVQRWTGLPKPYTRADAEAWVGPVSAALWASGSGAPFAVVDARSGELLGSAGIVRFDARHSSAEVGFWAAASARRQGVVTEATSAVCRWAFATRGVRCIEVRAQAGNEASRRVAEKVGFRFGGTLLGAADGADMWIATLRPGDAPPAEDVVEGYGLRLRPWRPGEAGPLAAHMDEATMRGTAFPGPAHAPEMLARRLAARWMGEARSWAVEEAGVLVGSAVLSPAEPEEGNAEIGYVVAPEARGRGIATRAARLALREAARAGAVRVTATVILGNQPSAAVVHRIGMRLEGVARSAADQRGSRVDLELYAIIRGDPGWPDLR